MKEKVPSRQEASPARITGLVQTLHATQRKLQRLTEGEVDAVIHPGGHAYLLHKAQEKLQQSQAAQRQTAETQLAILNAMPAHIALLDPKGVIVSVNETWKNFARENVLQGSQFSVGTNYLEICDRVTGAGYEQAHASATGIRRVLQGETRSFSYEYPCHSPTERCWFRLVATAVQEDQHAGAVVMHLDISEAKKIEEQLLWNMALLEAQVDSSLDGILIVDPNGMKVLQNQRMIELWNMPTEVANEADQRQRIRWLASQVKDPGPFIKKLTYLLDHQDEISRDELELIDGKWLDRYTAPVRGADGIHYGRIFTWRDITHQKEANESLSLFRNLIDQSPDGIEVIDPETCHFLDMNETGLRRLGYSREEMLALTVSDLSDDEGHRGGWREFVKDLRKAGSISLVGGHRRKDGSIFPVEINARYIDLNRGYVLAVIRDITERKRTEERLRLLIDSNLQGVLFWSRSGAVTGANNAFLDLTGYTREELEAGHISWMALTPPEYAHLDRRSLEQIDATGVSTPYEKEFIRKDGSRVPILLGAASFADNRNEGVCFVLDITERKNLENQFLRAQRMESIGTLAGGIAHDLNNILAPILMSIHILKATSADPEALDILETIEISAKRGADIVRQVLSFARGIEGERLEIQTKNLLKDLEAIIKDTFPKHIRLQFSVPSNAWTILGDPTQVQQILLNLCVNARDAMENGGSLIVTVKNVVLDEHYAAMNMQAKAGRFVNINVTDSGTGMPPELLEKIFEPFFTTKEVGKGTGLGLSTVVAIVKSHDGFINVYSEPGKGTTFKVHLPATETTSETAKYQTAEMAMPRGNGELVLLVDDEPSMRTITSQTLQSFGYRVLTATDGADAVAVYLAHRREVAVVLTDMMMPVMDGPAMIHAMMRINPEIKIIATSGLNANGGLTKVSEVRIKHFLTKPYTAATLLKTLRAIMEEE